MKNRGGARPRRWIPPTREFVSASGRWGRRHARVEQCEVVRAEDIYDAMDREKRDFGPDQTITLYVSGGGLSDVETGPQRLTVEILRNPIWPRGRFFVRCPRCGRRCTRVYKPAKSAAVGCRVCWSLVFVSQSWSYHGTEWQRLPCFSTTESRRAERRAASRQRQSARRTRRSKDPGGLPPLSPGGGCAAKGR